MKQNHLLVLRFFSICVGVCIFNIFSIAQIQIRTITPKQLDSLLPEFASIQSFLKAKTVQVKFLVHNNNTSDTTPYYKKASQGTEIPVAYSIKDGQVKSTTSFNYWAFQLIVPNATELGIRLSSINLSEDAEVYLLNSDNTALAGPIQKNKFNWSKTPHIPISLKTTEKITVVVKELKSQKKEIVSSFSITRLYSDDSGSKNTIFARQQPFTGCMPNIQCFPEKAQISRAVARMRIWNGSSWDGGTGTLISNELGNGRAYFLTAKHCVDLNNDGLIDSFEENQLLSAEFKFQYWILGCSGSLPEPGIYFIGAQIVAQLSSSDMILLELINPPGIGDDVTYAGWNRGSTLPSEDGSFVAHHPDFEHMRGAKTRNVNHWMWDATKWSVFYQYGDQGAATVKGSSGSALLNEYNQVVGTLQQGQVNCGNQSLGDQFEKLEHFWIPTVAQALSPNNLYSIPGIQTYNMEILGDEYIPCSGTITYSVPNFIGCTFTWTVSSNLQIVSGQGTNAIQVQRINNNVTGTIDLVINDSKGGNRSKSITKLVRLTPVITGTYNTCLNRDPLQLTGYDDVCAGETRVYTQQPAVSWTLIFGTPNSWSSTGTNNILRFNINQYDYVTFEATFSNGCQTFTQQYSFGATLEQSFSMYNVYPNPSTSYVRIEQSSENKKANISVKIQQVVVQSYSGRVFIDKKLGDNTFSTTIDVSQLPKDNYLLRVYNGKNWHTQKLIITK
jgi:hypothetical protein